MKNLFLIIFGILFLEAGLRLFWHIRWPQDLKWYKSDELSGAHSISGYHEIDKSPAGFTGYVNSLGYRGSEWSIKKHKNVYRIICVGDSVVLGLLTTKSDGDFPTQLGYLLNKNSNKKYEVYNAGLGGNNSTQTLYRLKNELLTYRPDLVIVSVGLNDLNETNPELPQSYQRGGVIRNLTKHSYLFRTFAGIIFKVVLPNIPLSKKELEHKKMVFDDFIPTHYYANLMDMAWLCKDGGIKIIFLTLPTAATTIGGDKYKLPYYARNLELFKIMIEKYNWVIRLVGSDSNVPVIDLAGYFSNLPNGINYFNDNTHLTDEGYKLFSQNVASEIFKN